MRLEDFMNDARTIAEAFDRHTFTLRLTDEVAEVIARHDLTVNTNV